LRPFDSFRYGISGVVSFLKFSNCFGIFSEDEPVDKEIKSPGRLERQKQKRRGAREGRPAEESRLARGKKAKVHINCALISDSKHPPYSPQAQPLHHNTFTLIL
jgi:hypothetical protein